MWDILNFNSFITQDVLIFFYYIGAVIIPVALYYFREYFIKKFSFLQILNGATKFIILFICMELCWRMMFEAMIGYFDMHDYLYEISKKLS